MTRTISVDHSVGGAHSSGVVSPHFPPGWRHGTFPWSSDKQQVFPSVLCTVAAGGAGRPGPQGHVKTQHMHVTKSMSPLARWGELMGSESGEAPSRGAL